MKEEGKASRIARTLAVSTSAVLALAVALLVGSTTGPGSASLRGIDAMLSRTLHAAGLLSDVQAGGGGLGSTSSGPGTSEPATVTIGKSAKLIARVVVAVP